MDLLLVAALLPVLVNSNTECPSAAAVEGRLEGLLGERQSQQPTDVALITRQEDGVSVHLRTRDGEPLASKQFDGRLSCQELADAVAVTLAAWHSHLRASFAGPEVTHNDEPPPGHRAEPDPEGFVEFGVGVGLSVNLDELSPELTLLSGYRQIRGLGVSLHGHWAPRRELTLAEGVVRYERANVSLGPTWSEPFGALRLDMELAGNLAHVRVGGQGFDVDHLVTRFEFGSAAHARIARPFGRWIPWLEARAVWWPVPQVARIEPGFERTLPAWEASVTFGSSWCSCGF